MFLTRANNATRMNRSVRSTGTRAAAYVLYATKQRAPSSLLGNLHATERERFRIDRRWRVKPYYLIVVRRNTDNDNHGPVQQYTLLLRLRGFVGVYSAKPV